ncbi:MAG: hypothetical protein JZD40_05175, partial [Sulfolobus sp.]|nr:hypothetical protein [Sulfolobus sp.]
MASEDEIINKILANPKLIDSLADRVYDRLKDEIVIKKLEELTVAVQELQKAIKKQGKRVEENSLRLSEQSKLIEEVMQRLEEHSETIKNLMQKSNEHTEAIRVLTQKLEEHSRVTQTLVQKSDEHSVAIKNLMEKMEEHLKVIQTLVQKMMDLDKTLSEHGKAIKGLQKAVLKLSTEIGSFTTRAGTSMEKTMMLLYKEALKLHGVDPNKVIHGDIVDTLGIINKGMTFEVDFHETNDYIYLFEIRNFGDEGAYEQILIRKKLMSVLFNKPLKIFLVANYVTDKVKEKLEKEQVVVI